MHVQKLLIEGNRDDVAALVNYIDNQTLITVDYSVSVSGLHVAPFELDVKDRHQLLAWHNFCIALIAVIAE